MTSDDSSSEKVQITYRMFEGITGLFPVVIAFLVFWNITMSIYIIRLRRKVRMLNLLKNCKPCGTKEIWINNGVFIKDCAEFDSDAGSVRSKCMNWKEEDSEKPVNRAFVLQIQSLQTEESLSEEELQRRRDPVEFTPNYI